MRGRSIFRHGVVAASLMLAFTAASTSVSAGAGLTLVKDINPSGSSNAGELMRIGDTMYLAAGDGVHGRELWKSDGTRARTRMVADIRPGRNGSQPRDLVDVRGTLFFTADDGVHGRELWASDGTRAGSHLVRDLTKGGDGSMLGQLTAVGRRLFFVRIRSCGDFCAHPAVWVSDGTRSGTRLVREMTQGDLDWPDLANLSGRLVFNDLAQLMVTDGTQTTLLKAFPDHRAIGSLTPVGNRLYFVHERALWVTDGTSRATVQLHRFTTGIGPALLTRYGQRLAFLAGDSWRALWISDGTAGGTRKVRTLGPTNDPDYGDMAVVSGRLFVSTGYEVGTPRLWMSDGTPGGTMVVTTFSGGEPAQALTRVGGVLCFIGFDGESWEVWESDGSTPGTHAISAFVMAHRAPYWLTAMDGTLYFTAADGGQGYELWSYAPQTATRGRG